MGNSNDKLVVAAIFSSPIDANIALGVLRTNDIQCVLTGETIKTVLGIQLAPSDGIRLLVHEQDYNKALELLGKQ